jgi:hypothetical protein
MGFFRNAFDNLDDFILKRREKRIKRHIGQGKWSKVARDLELDFDYTHIRRAERACRSCQDGVHKDLRACNARVKQNVYVIALVFALFCLLCLLALIELVELAASNVESMMDGDNT